MVGHVINANEKELAFFESVKPLIEGTQFYRFIDGHYELRQFYLDFSLLRINIEAPNSQKELLHIERIIKPELPMSTLDLIRRGDGEAFDWSLILEEGSKLKLCAMQSETLKKWIVGVNALLQNRLELTRLSTLIQIN